MVRARRVRAIVGDQLNALDRPGFFVGQVLLSQAWEKLTSSGSDILWSI